MNTTLPAYWRGRVDVKLDDHDDDLADLETRVSSLESFRWRAVGILTVAGALGSLFGGGLVSLVVYLITH